MAQQKRKKEKILLFETLVVFFEELGLLLELRSSSRKFRKKSVLWIRIVFFSVLDPAF
jgi:hypothetical protein